MEKAPGDKKRYQQSHFDDEKTHPAELQIKFELLIKLMQETRDDKVVKVPEQSRLHNSS